MCAEHKEAASAGGLDKGEWDALLDSIECDKCTPFLGAGACDGTLPKATRLAFDLATEQEYPLPDCDDLARVSQYVAVRSSPDSAKRTVLRMLGLLESHRSPPSPALRDEHDPHNILAQLPLRMYITTNYDDFMVKALRRHDRRADRDHCHWYKPGNGNNLADEADWEPPSVNNPLVFHLHGCNDHPESLVLTEDDYLDFLVNLGRHLDVVPPVVQGAIAQSSLLFIGYGLRDWNFRVLHRVLLSEVQKSQQWPSFTVQLSPFEFRTGCHVTVYMKNGDKITGEVIAGEPKRLRLKAKDVGTIRVQREKVLHVQVVDPGKEPLEEIEEVKDYLTKYFGKMEIRVYWGTADQFVRELWRRWKLRVDMV
jgi:SIR2-like domain